MFLNPDVASKDEVLLSTPLIGPWSLQAVPDCDENPSLMTYFSTYFSGSAFDHNSALWVVSHRQDRGFPNTEPLIQSDRHSDRDRLTHWPLNLQPAPRRGFPSERWRKAPRALLFSTFDSQVLRHGSIGGIFHRRKQVWNKRVHYFWTNTDYISCSDMTKTNVWSYYNCRLLLDIFTYTHLWTVPHTQNVIHVQSCYNFTH